MTHLVGAILKAESCPALITAKVGKKTIRDTQYEEEEDERDVKKSHPYLATAAASSNFTERSFEMPSPPIVTP